MLRFELGRTVATPAVLEALPMELIQVLLRRHQGGDWGDLDADDAAANDVATADGERILSAYDLGARYSGRSRVYVLTEADRSLTTVLFPDEY